jgi:hypothetical protein
MNKKFYIFFYLLIYIKTNINNNIHLCEELINKAASDEELVTTFENNFQSIKNDSNYCIEKLLLTSQYKTLEYYVIELNKNGIKFRETLDNAINSVTKTLQDILNKYKYYENDYQIVSPAFQWAQSLENIFIEVKFAHRFDSPGCLEINDLNKSFTNNSVYFSGKCILTETPIKFELNLNLYDKIIPEKCSVKFESVGRYQITIKKNEVKFWERLLFDKKQVFNNMRIWYEMRNKYEQELKKFDKDLNNDDDDLTFEEIAERIKAEKKKNRKKRKKQNKDNLNENENKNKNKQDL